MVTLKQLQTLYPRATPAVTGAFAKDAPELFGRFGIADTPNRLQFFLAQIGHESGGLTIVEEKLNYSAERMTRVWPSRFPTVGAAQSFAHDPEKLANFVYAGRMGNGPPAGGDGFRFRGRGYIQITGRDGYENVGARAGIDLVAKPERAAAPADALLVACAFWRWKNLNALCDTGDFAKVTRRINGKLVGIEDRRAWLDKVRRALAAAPAMSGQPKPDVARAVQLALRARGFTAIGAADGLIGEKTAAAIHLFRQRNGLGDGLIDDRLLDVLEIAA